MARLETEINQIYLVDPQTKKTSLILYDEAISNSAHLFVLAELADLKKKSEASDLKKITDIVLESFRSNKKLAAETLFESSLSQINQNLADLAHEGHKSWVGKFSCLICLKSGDNIFVANDGQAGAWLNRGSELLEVLGPEKRGTHPLKTFINFTQGKLIANDDLIMTTANIFNYVSFENFKRLVSEQGLTQASVEVSKILQDSVSDRQGFSAFFLHFEKPGTAPVEAAAPAETAYAPSPEEIVDEAPRRFIPSLPSLSSFSSFKFPKFSWPPRMPQFSWPKFNFNFRIPKFRFRKPEWEFFQRLSLAGKFFFVSFAVFLLLFLANLTHYFINHSKAKTQEHIQALITTINQEMTDAQSAVIYKNNDQALTLINQAQSDFNNLRDLDAVQADKLAGRLENIKTQINKVSTITAPQSLADLRHGAIFLGRAPTAFLLSHEDSNSLTEFTSSLKDYFLLNSLKSPVTGIAFFPQIGVVVSSGDTVYKIDNELEQFISIANFPNGNITSLRAWGNNLLALDRANGKIMKIAIVKGAVQASSVAAIGNANDVRDIGGDGDLYTLTADKLTRISGGKPSDIVLPNITDGINNANKLFVASNLYILEASKRRVVILNKAGVLQNQIYFPSLTTLHDFYVDEAGRSIYLLDDTKLYKITF